MDTFFTIIFVIFLIGAVLYYLAPRLLVWWLRRRVEDQMRQAAGQHRRADDGWPFGQWPFGQSEDQREPKRRRRGKAIGRDVGEYVEFEELKVYNSVEAEETKPVVTNPEPQVSDAEWEDL